MKFLFFEILVLLNLSLSAQLVWCGSIYENTDQSAQTEAFIRNYQPGERAVVTISVAVHIIYQNDDDNISDQRVVDALDALNEDYRAQNDLDIVPDNFANLIADTDIEFCLGQTPNSSSPTVFRRQTTIPNIGTASSNGQRRVFYNDLGGSDPIDPATHLNIYVCDMGGLIGQGIYPDNAGPIEDGVIISFDVFGRGDYLDPPYDRGRTLTHEVGHYLNLRHPWGNNLGDCSEDDLVNDTPNTSKNYLGDCSTTGNSCGSDDMPTNFMYYTDDACMANFTPDQKLRMLATLGGPRAGLPDGGSCMPTSVASPILPDDLKIFPNPVRGTLFIESQELIEEIRIFDASGRLIYSGTERQIATHEWGRGVFLLEIRRKDLRLSKMIVQ